MNLPSKETVSQIIKVALECAKNNSEKPWSFSKDMENSLLENEEVLNFINEVFEESNKLQESIIQRSINQIKEDKHAGYEAFVREIEASQSFEEKKQILLSYTIQVYLVRIIKGINDEVYNNLTSQSLEDARNLLDIRLSKSMFSPNKKRLINNIQYYNAHQLLLDVLKDISMPLIPLKIQREIQHDIGTIEPLNNILPTIRRKIEEKCSGYNVLDLSEWAEAEEMISLLFQLSASINEDTNLMEQLENGVILSKFLNINIIELISDEMRNFLNEQIDIVQILCQRADILTSHLEKAIEDFRKHLSDELINRIKAADFTTNTDFFRNFDQSDNPEEDLAKTLASLRL